MDIAYLPVRPVIPIFAPPGISIPMPSNAGRPGFVSLKYVSKLVAKKDNLQESVLTRIWQPHFST